MKSSDRFAVVSSTAGSVLNHVLERDQDFRRRLKLVVTDRPCGAEYVANRFGVPLVRIGDLSGPDFSDRLLGVLTHEHIDAAFLFFSRILSGPVLEKFWGRLINFHPSLLPAFPGLRGFEDGWNSSCLLLGSTVHLIDSGVDSGPVIQQTFIPVNRLVDNMSVIRHKIFLHQCASLSQVSDWLAEKRVVMVRPDRAVVRGANYSGFGGAVPVLEKEVAMNIFHSTSEM
jgi:phosphoribosylglycinamide formyltransferase-1